MIINYNNLVYIQKEADGSMIFFTISYIIFILLIIGELIIRSDKSSDIKRRKFESLRPLWVIGMVVYALVGVLAKDPLITDLLCSWKGICLAPTYEWIIYVGLLGVLIWAVILNPMSKDIKELKTDGTKIEGRLSKVEGTLDVVKSNTDKLLEFNLRKKK